MNYLVLVVALLQIGAAVYSFTNGRIEFGFMWSGIALANTMLFLIEGKGT